MKLNLKQRVVLLVTIAFGLFFAVAAKVTLSDWKYVQGDRHALKNLELINAMSSLVDAVQGERGKSALFINGKIDQTELSGQRNQVDSLIPKAETLLDESFLKQKSKLYIQDAIKDIGSARQIVDIRAGLSQATGSYNKLIEWLIKCNFSLFSSNTIDLYQPLNQLVV